MDFLKNGCKEKSYCQEMNLLKFLGQRLLNDTVIYIIINYLGLIEQNLEYQNESISRNNSITAINQQQFYSIFGFPGIIGIVDGTQWGIDGEVFRNRKALFSQHLNYWKC
ncbi:uncharacterized protein LOC115877705 isoform X1 [Sitophilus oryzae]|uniref:Uncharacterized protein LOC115877705 isoform X1 n=1 Tax=Sitophilus oryzae TaxID=7048 RepID=A0A6J2XER8_SITOR|nr:uncharacterized protein LOC115877705 isoform X1 [Sitophilus oryzae]